MLAKRKNKKDKINKKEIEGKKKNEKTLNKITKKLKKNEENFSDKSF